MANCPKDADWKGLQMNPDWCSDEVSAGVPNLMMICTRPKGHKGLCHAHTESGECMGKWKKKEEKNDKQTKAHD